MLPTRPILRRRLAVLALVLLVSPATITRAAEKPPSGANTIIRDVLKNIQDNGTNPNAQHGESLGGLFINWRTGTKPLEANLDGTGTPDNPGSVRHDILTDLRYLHNLWKYKNNHPSETQLDNDRERYTKIVKNEFANTANERGWLYDELIDLARVSKDDWYRQAARNLARNYAEKLYKPKAGTIYKITKAHPRGTYRVDLALDAGLALIQAGTEFREPTWVDKGKKTVQFVYDHAYIAEYHTFPLSMTEVLLPDGTVNPNEPIYRGRSDRMKIEGGAVKVGAIGQLIQSLLHTYKVTHERIYLDRATDLLTPLTAKSNTLGLWDPVNLGYHAFAIFPGPDAKHAGKPKIVTGRKESARQLIMLQVFHLANTLTKNQYQEMEDAMLKVAVEKAYYAPGRGYLYEMTPDWKPVTLKNGKAEDWVTTEAMGIALQALFAVNEKDAW